MRYLQMGWIIHVVGAPFGSTYTKIGTIQRRILHVALATPMGASAAEIPVGRDLLHSELCDFPSALALEEWPPWLTWLLLLASLFLLLAPYYSSDISHISPVHSHCHFFPQLWIFVAFSGMLYSLLKADIAWCKFLSNRSLHAVFFSFSNLQHCFKTSQYWCK